MIGECPARCGLTGGCHQCSPNLYPQAVAVPIGGWECPRCATVHSPYTPSCKCTDRLGPLIAGFVPQTSRIGVQ